MPASHVLGAALRLVDPEDSSDDVLPDAASATATLWAAESTDVGLALQFSLRETLRIWVTRPNFRQLRRYLKATEALATQLESRESPAAKADDRMLTTTTPGPIAGDDLGLIRARACARNLAKDLAQWVARSSVAARREAETIAWQMQDSASELLEMAGRSNAQDDRQANWLRLVAEPHTIDLARDDHACALIGAACWHDRGTGHVADWQGLAWRLWSLDSGELGKLVTEGRWPWRRRLRPLSDVGKALIAVCALIIDSNGRPHLRPREEAAKAALHILQAKRCDAEAAIQAGMTSMVTTYLPNLKDFS